MTNTINIGRQDVVWNYVATFLRIGTGVILLPFILRVFPQEMVAIWNIFSTIISMTALFDFGFNASFTRNVTYVMSGVKELKSTGYQIIGDGNTDIDYGLFKGLINAMRWFYSRIALILLVVLASAGTYYISVLLKTYTGDHREVYISWLILALINCYSFYTLYYDSLLQGRGMVKRAKQIEIVGQGVYFFTAVVLILFHFNLIALVSAQAVSIILRRFLSHYFIYTYNFKIALRTAAARSTKDFIKPILPNAVKIGITSLGGFLVSRSSVIVGALYLSLNDIASYGITMQIVMIIASLASVYFNTYQPKIVQCRIYNNVQNIRKIYACSLIFMLLIFVVFGLPLLFLGNWALDLIKSKTPLLSSSFIIVALIVHLLETNHSIAGSILLTKNEVPFFRAAICSGIVTIILMQVIFKCMRLGAWSMILAQGIAQGVYQNWKWPVTVIKELYFQ
jgi:O-antigen/teichoic acid export membrane protein